MADPLYRQIAAEDLRQQIESGSLPPGSQLAHRARGSGSYTTRPGTLSAMPSSCSSRAAWWRLGPARAPSSWSRSIPS